MGIETIALGELETNCYLVWDDSSREGVVIDPGAEGGYLSEKIIKLKIQLSAIILTHGHFDHVLGLLELHLNFPDVPIYIHMADLSLVKRASASAKHWLGHSTDPVPLPTTYFQQGDVINFGKSRLTVIETPGHTPGSVCLYSPLSVPAKGKAHDSGDGVLFSGDTLFKSGVGRTDFTYSSSTDLQKSLLKVFKLPPQTTIYPGHGEKSTLADEKNRVDSLFSKE